MVKNLPASTGNREMWIPSLGPEMWFQPLAQEYPLGRAYPTPVFLPGESPWTEAPGGLQSMRSQSGHD